MAERYIGAVVLTLAGFTVALLFQRLRGVPDALVFAATVALTARYLGTGPGVLASVLSIIAIDLTILPPFGSVELSHPEELAYLAVFVLLVVVINGTTHSLRVSRETAERLAMRSTRLVDVSTALSQAALPNDVAEVVVGAARELTEATSCVVGVIDGKELRVLARRAASGNLPVTGATIPLDSEGPLMEAVRMREPVWLESRERYRERFPQAYTRIQSDTAATAFLALPLVHGEEIVGGMMLGFAGAEALGATDQTFARLLAQSVGDALARARTLERERDGRRAAETMARAREEVLGIVAHDLRNPISLIDASLQMLSEPNITPADREKFLAASTRTVKQMNRLVGDLLDSIRLETGHLSLETEVLSVPRVLEEAADSVRHLAEQRRIALEVHSPETPLQVRADRLRLMQVFNNLLGNAIKFTPPSGRVELRSWKGTEDGDVVFEVADSGPGVSPENRAHLFDRFWQARRSDNRGVGLGLAITKGIVEAHGGHIWVDSEPGKGSRFRFTLSEPPAGLRT
jgi:K+-sensing histidine kinase KdpD